MHHYAHTFFCADGGTSAAGPDAGSVLSDDGSYGGSSGWEANSDDQGSGWEANSDDQGSVLSDDGSYGGSGAGGGYGGSGVGDSTGDTSRYFWRRGRGWHYRLSPPAIMKHTGSPSRTIPLLSPCVYYVHEEESGWEANSDDQGSVLSDDGSYGGTRSEDGSEAGAGAGSAGSVSDNSGAGGGGVQGHTKRVVMGPVPVSHKDFRKACTCNSQDICRAAVDDVELVESLREWVRGLDSANKRGEEMTRMLKAGLTARILVDKKGKKVVLYSESLAVGTKYRVCVPAWQYIFGWCKSTSYGIYQSVRNRVVSEVRNRSSHQHGTADRKARRKRPPNWRALDAEAWLTRLGTQQGDRLPNLAADGGMNDSGGPGGQSENVDEAREWHDKHSGSIVLPFYSQKEVYDQYVANFNRSRAEKRVKPLSYNQFRGMWQDKLKHLKVAKTKTGWAKCDECTHWRRKIDNATTPNLRAEYRQSLDTHLEHQRKQRVKYYKHRHKAQEHPDKYLSICIDAMDQAKCDLPHHIRSSKSDEKLPKLKQKLIAALVHGFGACVYIAPTPVGSGANFNIEVVRRTLEEVIKQRREENQDVVLPPTLYLQLDNASDNKSKALLAFCDGLVEQGVFKKVKLSFLLVGHTHEDIDQYFSVIARKIRWAD